MIRPGKRSIEGFNDHHAPPTARAWRRFLVGGAWVVVIILVALHRRRGHAEQASAKCKLVGAMPVGKEAIVANAMEAIRQHMEEEPADELGDRDAHDFALVIATFPVVLPAEADVGVIEIEQATVGDRDTVGVAREIGQHLLGTGEGRFGVDKPFGCAQRRESGGKCLCLVETDEIGKELQFAGIEGCRQTVEEQPPEHGREHVREKAPRLAGHPTLAIRRDPATRNEAVRMRMVLDVLAPRVQDGSDADVGAEVLPISGNRGEGLGRSFKQQCIDLGLVLLGHRADRGRNREYHVKIPHRQKLGFARCKPCHRSRPLAFWAMPIPAGIIGDACVRTVLAALYMTAERGSATNLDRPHDASLVEADVAGVGCAPRLTVAAKDVRHFQLRSPGKSGDR